MPPKAKREGMMEIIPPDLRTMVVTIHGQTPLLVSNGTAAVEKIEAGQTGPKQKTPLPPRDPEAEFQESRYLDEDGHDGFPAPGIKRAIKDAAIRAHAGVGTEVMANVQIDGALLPLDSPEPILARHFVRRRRVANVAYRAQYTSWRIRVPITYNAGAIAAEHIVSLFQLAGFSIGIGAWRPEKNGTFGRFEVEKVEIAR